MLELAKGQSIKTSFYLDNIARHQKGKPAKIKGKNWVNASPAYLTKGWRKEIRKEESNIVTYLW